MTKVILLLYVLLLMSISCGNPTREARWKLTLKSRIYAEPIVDGERFYCFSQAGEAVSALISSGKKLWDVSLEGPILGTPATSNDAIFLATQNGYIYSIKKENGVVLWKKHYDDLFIAGLAIQGNQVLVPSETGTLYAVSATDSKDLWQISGQKKFNARPVLSGNNILVGSWQRQLLSLKSDGTVNWRFLAAEILAEEPIVNRSTIFVPAYDHYVYALDAQTGKLLWRHAAVRPSNIVLYKGEIVFASDKDLVYVSATSGRTMRRLRFGKLISRLYVQESQLYAVSGAVYLVNSSDSTTSVIIQNPNPLFKLSFGPGMILAVDRLYSIYGYAGEQAP